MFAERIMGLVVALALLLLPVSPPSAPNTGGSNWVCFAYGALAGAAVMTGSVVGALSCCLGAGRAGCFG